MKKKEARAILTCAAKIQDALSACLMKLDEGGDAQVYAENYWASSIKSITKGVGYGSMPISQAEATLGREEGNK